MFDAVVVSGIHADLGCIYAMSGVPNPYLRSTFGGSPFEHLQEQFDGSPLRGVKNVGTRLLLILGEVDRAFTGAASWCFRRRLLLSMT